MFGAKQHVNLASRLRQIRDHFGLTQNVMSACLDVSFAAYKNYEKGKREPTVSMLQILCSRYYVNADWLLLGKGTIFDEGHEQNLDQLMALEKLTDGDPSELREYGGRVRQLREASGLTQKEFAEFLGINYYRYKDIENGNTKVNIRILNILEKIENVSRSWLLTGKSEEFISSASVKGESNV